MSNNNYTKLSAFFVLLSLTVSVAAYNSKSNAVAAEENANMKAALELAKVEDPIFAKRAELEKQFKDLPADVREKQIEAKIIETLQTKAYKDDVTKLLLDVAPTVKSPSVQGDALLPPFTANLRKTDALEILNSQPSLCGQTEFSNITTPENKYRTARLMYEVSRENKGFYVVPVMSSTGDPHWTFFNENGTPYYQDWHPRGVVALYVTKGERFDTTTGGWPTPSSAPTVNKVLTFYHKLKTPVKGNGFTASVKYYVVYANGTSAQGIINDSNGSAIPGGYADPGVSFTYSNGSYIYDGENIVAVMQPNSDHINFSSYAKKPYDTKDGFVTGFLGEFSARYASGGKYGIDFSKFYYPATWYDPSEPGYSAAYKSAKDAKDQLLGNLFWIGTQSTQDGFVPLPVRLSKDYASYTTASGVTKYVRTTPENICPGAAKLTKDAYNTKRNMIQQTQAGVDPLANYLKDLAKQKAKDAVPKEMTISEFAVPEVPKPPVADPAPANSNNDSANKTKSN